MFLFYGNFLIIHDVDAFLNPAQTLTEDIKNTIVKVRVKVRVSNPVFYVAEAEGKGLNIGVLKHEVGTIRLNDVFADWIKAWHIFLSLKSQNA